MMIKNRTKFALTVGIGLSVLSGVVQTALTTMDSVDSLTIMSPGVTAPSRLGALGLIHDDEQRFSVLRENGEINEIPNHLVAKDLRGISQDEVKARLDNNINFRVQQGSDGEFSLQECGGLDGGGPILASALYWGVKGTGYIGLGAVVGLSTCLVTGAQPGQPADGATTATGLVFAHIAVNSGAVATIESMAVAAGAAGLVVPSP